MTWIEGSRPSRPRSRPRPWRSPRRGRRAAPGRGRGRGHRASRAQAASARAWSTASGTGSSPTCAGPRRTTTSSPGMPRAAPQRGEGDVTVREAQEARLDALPGAIRGPRRRLHDVAARGIDGALVPARGRGRARRRRSGSFAAPRARAACPGWRVIPGAGPRAAGPRCAAAPGVARPDCRPGRRPAPPPEATISASARPHDDGRARRRRDEREHESRRQAPRRGRRRARRARRGRRGPRRCCMAALPAGTSARRTRTRRRRRCPAPGPARPRRVDGRAARRRR